jgi:hypothetical protein
MRNVGVLGCYRNCGSEGTIPGIFYRLFTVPIFLELQSHSGRLGVIYLELISDRDDPNPDPEMVHVRVDPDLEMGSQSRCLEPRDDLVAEVSWFGLSLDFGPSSHTGLRA